MMLNSILGLYQAFSFEAGHCWPAEMARLATEQAPPRFYLNLLTCKEILKFGWINRICLCVNN